MRICLGNPPEKARGMYMYLCKHSEEAKGPHSLRQGEGYKYCNIENGEVEMPH